MPLTMGLPVLLALLAAFSAPQTARANTLADQPMADQPAFWLARHGQPAATIVLAADPLPSNQLAAEELQLFVQRISGAILPIVSDDQPVTGPRVLIGRSAHTDALGIEAMTGVTPELKEEGYLLRVAGEALVLLGNDDGPVASYDAHLGLANTYKGSLLAVYDLLARLGCRWYMPGPIGEVVPASRDVSIGALNEVRRPSFPVRGLFIPVPSAQRRDEDYMRGLHLWQMRNRLLSYGSIFASAGDGSIMAPFRKWRTEMGEDGQKKRVNVVFEEHPEYFALRADGSRNEKYLCLSEPVVLEVVVADALERLSADPSLRCVGYAPPDGAPTCECARCKERNLNLTQFEPARRGVQDISEGFYGFLNQVALRVKEKFPDRWITTTAYSGRTRPPLTVELSDNISVRVALLEYARMHRLDFAGWQTQQQRELLRQWGRACARPVERTYMPAILQFHCNVAQPMPRALAYNLRTLRGFGYVGADYEARPAFVADGINQYLRATLLWDLDADVEALLEDYYTRALGPAAGAAQRFYDALEQQFTAAPLYHTEGERIPEMYPPAFVERIASEFNAAPIDESGLDQAMRDRLALLRLTVETLVGYSRMRQAEADLDLPRAIAQGRELVALTEQARQLGDYLIDPYGQWFDEQPTYGELGAQSTAAGMLRRYEALASMMDGRRGRLVAALPRHWDFRTDPHDQGVIARWFDPATRQGAWTKIDTTLCWEAQGHQDEQLRGYDGYAWYRTSFDPTDLADGQAVHLFLGAVNNQAWVWVNGQLVAATPYHQYWQRWRYHADLDITAAVRPGQVNEVVVRVYNDQDFGGLFRRCFVYSPVAGGE